MGCDIHGWVEQKHNGKWVAIKEFGSEASLRNYERFALLAGVRDYSVDSTARPKGIPDDVSDTVKLDIERWGTDGHSHSYISMREAVDVYRKSDPGSKSDDHVWNYFNVDIEYKNIDDLRIVFWFDN